MKNLEIVHLRTILEEMEKIEITKLPKQKRWKELEMKKIDELEELERKLHFTARKNKFCVRPNSYKEELVLRKITRKR